MPPYGARVRIGSDGLLKRAHDTLSEGVPNPAAHGAGPTHHNLVANNVITRNATDCGITAPGHNPGAVNAAGVSQPTVAGVYDNVIRGNEVTGNGLKGEGAGVLFANAAAGTASYNNLVEGNDIAGNELSGVTMHAHTLMPGQVEDLNGNTIIGKKIGKNNTGGDPLDSPASPEDLQTR